MGLMCCSDTFTSSLNKDEPCVFGALPGFTRVLTPDLPKKFFGPMILGRV
jgi:hypothetical protein